jgi:prepilin-type N-terminal cleavage/methylation domain-containing protein
MKRNRAFTLIELLVVIAIIAILAAILFPVFAQAKMAAKKTQSVSNFKQVGTSLTMYMTDFDDRMPNAPCIVNVPVAHGCDEMSMQTTWRYRVQPYMKNKDLFNPPGHEFPRAFYPNTVYWFERSFPIESKAGITPGMAGAHTWTHNDYYGYSGLSHTDVPRPASLLMLMPSRWEFADLGPWTVQNKWLDPNAYPGKGSFQSYTKKVNFAMFDTHVITRNPCSTFGALKWAPGTTPDDDFLWEWFSNNPTNNGPVDSNVLRDWQKSCNEIPEYK